MNKVILMGRMTKDVEVRYAQKNDGSQVACARYTLAVDRRVARNAQGQQTADFINCTAFGKTAEFLEKYGRKGTKFVLEGRIQTGSYTNREGHKVYTTEVCAENIDFAESKGTTENAQPTQPTQPATDANGFMNIPSDVDIYDIPWT